MASNWFAGALGPAASDRTNPDEMSFMKQAYASDAPVNEIPRSGFFPQILAKTGLISPMLQATPDQMADQQILLKQKHEAETGAKLNQLAVFSQIADKMGGDAALGMAKSIFGTDFNALDPGTLAAVKLIHGNNAIQEQQNKALDNIRAMTLSQGEQRLEYKRQQDAITNQFTEQLRAIQQQGQDQRGDMIDFGHGKGSSIDTVVAKSMFSTLFQDPNLLRAYVSSRQSGKSEMEAMQAALAPSITPSSSGSLLTDLWNHVPGGTTKPTPGASDAEILKALRGGK